MRVHVLNVIADALALACASTFACVCELASERVHACVGVWLLLRSGGGVGACISAFVRARVRMLLFHRGASAPSADCATVT